MSVRAAREKPARGYGLASVNHRTAKLPYPEGGLRERNKAEKLRKIRRAARELFIEKGYDSTTTREIASRAGVGLGTLFTYAADKRDLLFLIFNDELDLVAEAAFGHVPPVPSLAEQLVGIFREFYAYFAQQPHLARFMLRELAFYIAGSEARRFQRHREQIVLRLADLIDAAKAQKRIATTDESMVVGRVIFAIYQAEIREWLSDETSEPEIETGLASLHRALHLLVTGLKPRDRTR